MSHREEATEIDKNSHYITRLQNDSMQISKSLPMVHYKKDLNPIEKAK